AWNVELGGVDHHRVIGRSQRCRLPVGITLVTSGYLPKKGSKASIVFLAIQLLMAPERPGFSARRQENLGGRIRENHGAHVASVGDQSGRHAEVALALHQGLANLRKRRDL